MAHFRTHRFFKKQFKIKSLIKFIYCHVSAKELQVLSASPKLLKIASTCGKAMPGRTISKTPSEDARVRSMMVDPRLSSPRTPACCRHCQVPHAHHLKQAEGAKQARLKQARLKQDTRDTIKQAGRRVGKIQGQIPPSKTCASCPHSGLNSCGERELEALLGLAEVSASAPADDAIARQKESPCPLARCHMPLTSGPGTRRAKVSRSAVRLWHTGALSRRLSTIVTGPGSSFWSSPSGSPPVSPYN